MGQSQRQGVRRVRFGQFGQIEHPLHHRCHGRFLGAAEPTMACFTLRVAIS